MSFLPGALTSSTFAHAASLGARGKRRGKKRPAKTSRSRKTRKKRSSGGGRRKPKPGTKAWMAYIRGKRGKKR